MKSKVELLEEVSKGLDNIESKALMYFQTGRVQFFDDVQRSKMNVLNLYAALYDENHKMVEALQEVKVLGPLDYAMIKYIVNKALKGEDE